MKNSNDSLKPLMKEYYPQMSYQFIDRIYNKVLDADKVETTFQDQISLFKNSDKRILIIPVDGFSGVGKSTIINKIKNIIKFNGLDFRTIEFDKFLGAIADDRSELMLQNRENFKRLFYNDEKILIHLLNACEYKPGENFISTGTYIRNPFASLDGTQEFSVPQGKFVLILDGVKSTSYLVDKVKEKKDVSTKSLFIAGDPANSILRATFRDVFDKGRVFERVLETRLKEYHFLNELMISSIIRTNLIIINRKSDEVLKEQIKRYNNENHPNKIGNIQTLVSQSVHNFWAMHVNDNAKSDKELLFSSVLGARMSQIINQNNNGGQVS